MRVIKNVQAVNIAREPTALVILVLCLFALPSASSGQPDLVVNWVSSSQKNVNSQDRLNYSFQIANVGDEGPAGNSTFDVSTFLSIDRILGQDDIELGTGYSVWTYHLFESWIHEHEQSALISAGVPPGAYYLIVLVDAHPGEPPNYYPGVDESDESNNSCSTESTILVTDDSVLPELAEEYLIITRSMFLPSLTLLVQAKQNAGLQVQVKCLSEIENEYLGEDIIEKIRNCIKDHHENHNCIWVLLVGSPDADENPGDSQVLPAVFIDKEWELPVRYVYCPTTDYTYIPSESYYSNLDGDWDADGDGIYGEKKTDCSLGIEEVDWLPDVNLGRIPARLTTDVDAYIEKLLNSDYSSLDISQVNFLQISCVVEDQITDVTIPGLVLANSPEYDPPTIDRVNVELNNNCYHVVTITGHGNEYSWGLNDGGWTGSGLLPGGSIFFCYAAACLTSYIDKSNTISTLTENLLFKPGCGSIGYIGAWRLSTPIGQNDLWRSFWRTYIDGANTVIGSTHSIVDRSYYFWYAYWHHNFYNYYRYTQLLYSYFGDPQLFIGLVCPNGPRIVSVPAVCALNQSDYHYDDDNCCEAYGEGSIVWEKVSGPEYFSITTDGYVTWVPDPGIEPGNNGRPTIVIKASDNNGSTYQHWVVQCTPSYSFIEVTSVANLTGLIGEPYVYDGDNRAEADMWLSATWKCIEGPKGMNVDHSTGHISWIPERSGAYEIILQAMQPEPSSGYHTDFQRFVVNVTGGSTDTNPGFSAVTMLHDCYPNPFNPTTTIRFDLPRSEHVILNIYNVTGESIATLIDQMMNSGRSEVLWDARNNSGRAVASGIYFYRLVAGDFVQTKKMVLLR